MSVTASELRTLARCILASVVRKQAGTLSTRIEPCLEAWCEALSFLSKELGESFPGTMADTVTRRAVGMLLREQSASNAAQDEIQALLTKDDAIKNMLADGDWLRAAEVLQYTAIGAYHAALAEGQS